MNMTPVNTKENLHINSRAVSVKVQSGVRPKYLGPRI